MIFIGWYVSGDGPKLPVQKIYFSGSVIAIGVFGCAIVRSLEWRYHEFTNAINRINWVQRTQEEGIYLEGTTLWPKHWVDHVTENPDPDKIKHSFEPTFKISIGALLFVSIFGAVTVWFV
jgi:hypothetical protein